MVASRIVSTRTVELDLFGQRLTVRSDNDPEDVQAIVAYVNQKLNDAKTRAGSVRNEHVALMAALNIAEELFQERARLKAMRREIRQAAHTLVGAVDALETVLPC